MTMMNINVSENVFLLTTGTGAMRLVSEKGIEKETGTSDQMAIRQIPGMQAVSNLIQNQLQVQENEEEMYSDEEDEEELAGGKKTSEDDTL